MQINIQVISAFFVCQMIHTCSRAQNSKTSKVLSARVTDNDNDSDDDLSTIYELCNNIIIL